MKIYNLTGYLIIFSYMLACMYFAPAHLGPWTGMLIGGVYFAMNPSGVKSDKDQIRKDDRFRKSKHERSKDQSADQRVVHEVGA